MGEEGAARGPGTSGMPQLESPTFLPVGAAHLVAAGSRCVLTMQVLRGEEREGGLGTRPMVLPGRVGGTETSGL